MKGTMNRIANILTSEHICDIEATTKDSAILELCELISTSRFVVDLDKFITSIRSREAIMSTGIGMGIAIPHAKTSYLQDFVMAVGRSRKGVDFNSLDGLPVHVIILIGSSDTQGKDFLKVLADIGRTFKDESYLQRFLEAQSPKEMYNLIINRFD
ncbi:PTS sugar transporter subunit IIA [Candidatus Latescibacterota bacterium]